MRRSRPLKNVDSVLRTQLLKIFVWLFFAFGFIGFVWKGVMGVLLGGVLGLILTPLISFGINKTGDAAGILYGGRRAAWTLEEQIAGDMDRVRYSKMKKDYDQALRIVDEVLEKAPQSLEALLLKSQILAEGFKDYPAAEACLEKLFRACSDRNEPVRRWAADYRDQLMKLQRGNP